MGSTFTPEADFLDLGGRDAVDKVLSRLAAKGTIRRLARGLYDYPREHAELGVLSPDIEKVAKALAGKDRIRLQPAGAYAARPAWIVRASAGQSCVFYGRNIAHREDWAAGNPVTTHHAEKHGGSRAIGRLADTGIAAFGQRAHAPGARGAFETHRCPSRSERSCCGTFRLAPASWMHATISRTGWKLIS